MFIRQFRKSSKLMLKKTSTVVYRWKHSLEKAKDSYFSSSGTSLQRFPSRPFQPRSGPSSQSLFTGYSGSYGGVNAVIHSLSYI